MMKTQRIALMLLTLALVVPVAGASDNPGEVTIHRDEWGVPYIYAATDADAAYGLGYAMAEDRLGDLFTNIRTATGTMSEVFGKGFVDQDYALRVAKIPQRCQAYWETAPSHLTEIGDSFIRGVEAFMVKHPEKIPEWAVELHGWQTAAIGEAMIARWPLGQIQDELKNTQNSAGFGSNQWAVSPKRSADDCAILLTDPHLTWEGLAVFYEANVVSKEMEMHGFFLLGSPLLALGHNGHVGWAATTGGPDTADVYELELNPANPLQYKYDDEWKSAKLEMISIKVKGEKTVTRPSGFTHLGPLFSEPDYEKNRAYVGATPYFDTIGLTEQFHEMCRAKSTDELFEAMSANHYMEQNIMYADRQGNIQYTRVGRVPIRPDGYDWTKAVPGNTSKTAWKGIHDIKDLVGIKNPVQGYMQNCNTSPAEMMFDSPMTPDKYKDYIYNVSWDDMNTRGTRSRQLLSEDDSITKEEAKAIAFDVYDVLSAPWQLALQSAIDAHGLDSLGSDDARRAVKILLAWDGQFLKESTAPPLVKFWRQYTQNKVDVEALHAGSVLSDEHLKEVLLGVDSAVEKLNEQHGTSEIAWGEIHKVGRSDLYYPVDGGVLGGSAGTRTLLNVRGREIEKGSGVEIANNGSMSMVLMFFHEDGIEAYTCIPWGQSGDSTSPHHMDQGKSLYTQRRFKPMLSTLKEVEEHAESTLVLPTL